MLFRRRDKKAGSQPVDVPAQRAPRSPGHPPPCAEDTYVGVAMGSAARAGGGTRRRHRPKRRDAQPHYTDDDYLMMGPMHLDEDTSSGSQAGSLKRRAPAGRRATPAEDDSYMAMEPVRPLGSPLAATAGGDYLNMDMSVRRAPPSAVYVNVEEISGGVPGPTPPPAADTSDYLAMTPRALVTTPFATPAAPAAADTDSDYLEMTMPTGGRPAAPVAAVSAPVQRSQSARSSAEREPERWPAGSRRDPDTYCPMEVPRRPVSALLSIQTSADGSSGRRKSDAAPLDDRRRSTGSGISPGSGSGAKVQRKNSGVTGAGLLRKLDAMNPRAMFRTLSQRGKKDSKRLSPGASESGAAPAGIDRSPSSQSLSSSNSIQEEVEASVGAAGAEPLLVAGVPVFRAAEPAPDTRLGSASPSGSVVSVTPRASLASSQATTPRQTPAPTPTPTPTPLPLTTSSSLTSFAPAAAAAAAAVPAVRQRHESNPPPCSQNRPQRPQTGCGSRSLTALPTEEPEVVYASLDLVDGDPATCQAQLAAANKLTYAKIDFKETGKLKQRES